MGISVVQRDITKIQTDVVVNAANKHLRGGGGVDGAIHRAGGPSIMEECRAIGSCPTGEAVITTAGKLPAKKVIHTVGPVWNGGKDNEEALLTNAYQNTLDLAFKANLYRILFPNISTGVYGFPKKRAAEIAMDVAKTFIEGHPEMDIVFVCFDQENYEIYKQLIS